MTKHKPPKPPTDNDEIHVQEEVIPRARGWDGGPLYRQRIAEPWPPVEPSEKDDALAKLIHRSMGGTPQEAAARTITGEDDEEIDRAIQAMKDAGVPLGDEDSPTGRLLTDEEGAAVARLEKLVSQNQSNATHWTPASARRAYEPPTVTKLVPAPRAPPAGHVPDAVLNDARQALTAITLNAAHLAFALRTFAPPEHAPGAVAAANEIEAAVFRINELLTRSNMEKTTMEARSKDDENKAISGPTPHALAEAIVEALLRYPEHGIDELRGSMRLTHEEIAGHLRHVLADAVAYRKGVVVFRNIVPFGPPPAERDEHYPPDTFIVAEHGPTPKTMEEHDEIAARRKLCSRCQAPLNAQGACSRREEGCQGGWGESR